MTFPAIVPAPAAAWRWLVDIPLRRALAAAPDEPIPFTLTPKADEMGPADLLGPDVCISCEMPAWTGIDAYGQCAWCRDYNPIPLDAWGTD